MELAEARRVLLGHASGGVDSIEGSFALVATTVGMWGVRVPMALIVALWLHLSVYYVWMAMIADWTVRMALLLWRYQSERWRAIQVIR